MSKMFARYDRNVQNIKSMEAMTAMASFMTLSEKVPVRKEVYFWDTWKALMKNNYFKAAGADKVEFLSVFKRLSSGQSSFPNRNKETSGREPSRTRG